MCVLCANVPNTHLTFWLTWQSRAACGCVGSTGDSKLNHAKGASGTSVLLLHAVKGESVPGETEAAGVGEKKETAWLSTLHSFY